MTALFNKEIELVGWLSNNGLHIFDANLNWVAFIKNNHVWSAKTGNWCGPINGYNCLDKNGKVVAWSAKQAIKGSVKPVQPVKVVMVATPVKPVKPINPIKPTKKASPIHGWSTLSFNDWVIQ